MYFDPQVPRVGKPYTTGNGLEKTREENGFKINIRLISGKYFGDQLQRKVKTTEVCSLNQIISFHLLLIFHQYFLQCCHTKKEAHLTPLKDISNIIRGQSWRTKLKWKAFFIWSLFNKISVNWFTSLYHQSLVKTKKLKIFLSW